jgi:hypothetical protein
MSRELQKSIQSVVCQDPIRMLRARFKSHSPGLEQQASRPATMLNQCLREPSHNDHRSDKGKEHKPHDHAADRVESYELLSIQ